MKSKEKSAMEKKTKLSFNEYYSGANEAQKQAIESDSALTVVAASAGTGKTYTLAQKVAYILSDEEKNVASSEILVLTFTVKAAQEMSERIKSTLSKWYDAKLAELAKDDGLPSATSRLAYLKEKLDRLDEAYISNIHSFSKRVISEGGLALDLDPTAEIISEPQASRCFSSLEEELNQGKIDRFLSLLPDEATNDVISRHEAEEYFEGKADDVKELLQFYGTENLVDAVRLVGDNLPSHGFTMIDLWNWQEESETSCRENAHSICCKIREIKLLQMFSEWQNAVELYKANYGELEITNEKYLGQLCIFDFANYVTTLENIHDAKEQDEFYEEIEKLLELADGLVIRKESPVAKLQQYLPQGTFASWKKNYKDKIRPFCDLSNLETELRAKSLLDRVVAILWHSYISYKKENNLIELSELVQNAKKLFERDEKFRKKFKYIFVDEFQDTDPLQDALINALWHKPSDKNDVENHLFIVGDFKQSIYSFRGAEPSLLLNYKKYALENERSGAKELACFIALRENYRTEAPLIESINEFFSKIWSNSCMSDFAYGDDDKLVYPVCKKDEQSRETNSSCTFWTYDVPGKMQAQAQRTIRAESVAEDIVTKAQGEGQNWSDFCVLVRSRSEFAPLEAAFNRRNVPFVLCEAKDFFGKIETEDIINYLTLLDDEENMTALASWLMSPISSVTREKAIQVLEKAEKRIKEYEEQGKLPKKKSLVLREVFEELLPASAENLKIASRNARILGASAAIENLLENQEKLLMLVGEGSRKRLLLNLMHIKEITREFEECFTPSLTETVDYLAESLNKNVESLEPDLAELGSNAVTVMTIHSSKGLEFKNVNLLLNADKKAHSDPKKIIVSNKFACLPSSYKINGREAETLLRKVYRQLRKEDEEAETKRLIYVGFTRAKENLTVSLLGGEAEEGNMFDVSSCTTIAQKIFSEDDIATTLASTPQECETLGRDLDLVTKMPKRLARLTASAFALWSWCPVSYRASYRQGKTLVWQGENGEGSDFGTACHRALERWNFEPQSLVNLTAKGKHGKQIFEVLSEFSKSDSFKEIAKVVANGQAIREAAFDVELSYDTEKLHLVGVIDLLWQDENGLHIRDWKTTEEEKAPQGFYQRQLDFYALALALYMKQNGKELPIDAAIIYLSSDKKIESTLYNEEMFEEIKQEVINCSIACAGSDFAPALHLCSSCPMALTCRKE